MSVSRGHREMGPEGGEEGVNKPPLFFTRSGARMRSQE
jgi:hypothetical protein